MNTFYSPYHPFRCCQTDPNLKSKLAEVRHQNRKPAQSGVPNNARLKTDLAWAQPSDPREAAWVVTLPAGAYTAVVESTNGTPGVAIVEIYEAN